MSPITLNILSLIPFLAWHLLDPIYYEGLISERYVYSELVYLLVFFCSITFFVGCFVSSLFCSVVNTVNQKPHFDQIYIRRLEILLGLLFLLSLISTFDVLNSGALSSFISGDFLNIKENLSGDFRFMAGFYIFEYCLLYYYAICSKRESCVYLWISILYVLCMSALRMARYDLMPFLFALFYIPLSRKRFLTQFYSMLVVGVFFVLLFSIFSYMRGEVDVEQQMRVLVGYTLTSYNRLAGLVQGDLVYMYDSNPYILRFMSHIPLLSSVYNANELYGGISPADVMEIEFATVAKAGFNSSFIWLTSIGYLFVDIGWYVLIFYFLYGLICHRAWLSFSKYRDFGVVFYPWIAYCVLFTFSSNFQLYPNLIYFLISWMLISVLRIKL